MEPAAAGAASPCHETGWLKMSAHLVYPRLPVAVEVRSKAGEEGFLLTSGGEDEEYYFAYFCSVVAAVISLQQMYLMC